MTNIADLTTGQLLRIIAIKEQIEVLQSQIDSIAGDGGEIPSPAAVEAHAPAKRKYHMTAAHRRKLIKALAKARRIRAAKLKAQKATPTPAKKKDRRSSPAVRAKLAAAARARWARVRAEGKKGL
jgi:phage protein D